MMGRPKSGFNALPNPCPHTQRTQQPAVLGSARNSLCAQMLCYTITGPELYLIKPGPRLPRKAKMTVQRGKSVPTHTQSKDKSTTQPWCPEHKKNSTALQLSLTGSC